MKRLVRFVALGAILVGVCGAATAQEMAGNEGVMERPRPDYDAKGLPLGGFRLFPKFDVKAGYDDNLLRQPTATIGTGIFVEQPSFVLRSEWSRHSLGLLGYVQSNQYTARTSENNTNWSLGGNGRLDIIGGSDINTNFAYSVLHEARTSPELPGLAAKPTEYSLAHGDIAARYNPFHFGFTLGAKIDRFEYKPTAVVAPGLPINNRDRNHDETDVYAKAGYEFSPGYAVFAQADYVAQNYVQALDRNLQRRSNQGYRINAGVDLLVSQLVRGEVYVGYLNQNYKLPFGDVSGVNYGAKLDWFPTQVLTVHLAASHTLEATTLINASTNDTQQVSLSADYELARNIILQGNVGYTSSNFKGTARTDNVFGAGIGATYLMNRYLSATFRYNYDTRSSTLAGSKYNDSQIWGGLALHL